MREILEDCLGRQIKSVVITLSTHLNISQYQAITIRELISQLRLLLLTGRS